MALRLPERDFWANATPYRIEKILTAYKEIGKAKEAEKPVSLAEYLGV